MLYCHTTARGEGRNVADTRGNQAVSEDHRDADHQDEGAWFSWLERLPVTQEAADSSPVAPASLHAILGLLYVQRSKWNMLSSCAVQ
jgi:hypothetical protein